MAGTDDRVTFQLALVQRTATVRAAVDEPVEAPFFAHQQHGDTVRLCARQRSSLEPILAEDRGPLFRTSPNAVWFTPTPPPKERCPPSKAENAATEYPSAEGRRRRPCRPAFAPPRKGHAAPAPSCDRAHAHRRPGGSPRPPSFESSTGLLLTIAACSGAGVDARQVTAGLPDSAGNRGHAAGACLDGSGSPR